MTMIPADLLAADLDACLHEAFEARVRHEPSRIALVDGDRSFTYRELDTAANTLACELREYGVRPECSWGSPLGDLPSSSAA